MFLTNYSLTNYIYIYIYIYIVYIYIYIMLLYKLFAYKSY